MAKKIKLTRKQMKRPDEFLSITEKAFEWAEDHAWHVGGIAVGVIALMLLVKLGAGSLDKRADVPRSAYAMAINTLERPVTPTDPGSMYLPDMTSEGFGSEEEKYQSAAEALDKVIEEYSSAVEGQMALLNLASIYEKTREYDKAISAYGRFLSSELAAKDESFKHLAWSGLARANFESREYQTALDYYNKIAERDSIIKSNAMIGAARCYNALGEKGRADEILAKAGEEVPDSWSAKPSNFLPDFWKRKEQAGTAPDDLDIEPLDDIIPDTGDGGVTPVVLPDDNPLDASTQE